MELFIVFLNLDFMCTYVCCVSRSDGVCLWSRVFISVWEMRCVVLMVMGEPFAVHCASEAEKRQGCVFVGSTRYAGVPLLWCTRCYCISCALSWKILGSVSLCWLVVRLISKCGAVQRCKVTWSCCHVMLSTAWIVLEQLGLGWLRWRFYWKDNGGDILRKC